MACRWLLLLQLLGRKLTLGAATNMPALAAWEAGWWLPGLYRGKSGGWSAAVVAPHVWEVAQG